MINIKYRRAVEISEHRKLKKLIINDRLCFFYNDKVKQVNNTISMNYYSPYKFYPNFFFLLDIQRQKHLNSCLKKKLSILDVRKGGVEGC